jgi:hypothetical protein
VQSEDVNKRIKELKDEHTKKVAKLEADLKSKVLGARTICYSVVH